MKNYILLGFLFLLFSCNPISAPEGPISKATPSIQAPGDAVQIVEGGADVYDSPNGTIVDFANAGELATVIRERNGWIELDFENIFNGKLVVDGKVESTTPPDTIPPGCEPNCPVPGEYQLIMVGFSNTRQIITGASDYGFDIGDADPRMRGKAIQTYGDPGAASYAEGLAIVRDQVANHPGADGIAVMLGHRFYAENPGGIIEGARSFDVVDTLDAPYSGSPRYSEMQMVRNVAAMLDTEAPGLDHYLVGLHRYVPENNCERKIGTNVPLALEFMITTAVAEGIVSPLEIGGIPFALGPVIASEGHISVDNCHLSDSGIAWVWQKEGGLIELINGL